MWESGDLRKRLKFSTCSHAASLTFKPKKLISDFFFLSLLFEGEKLPWGFRVHLPPWVYSRWHCSMTDGNALLQFLAARWDSPLSQTLKLKYFWLTVVITPPPSYLKIKGSFIHYFHLISSSFQSFKNQSILPKPIHWNLCEMYVNMQGGWHSTAGPDRRKPRTYLERSQGKGPCLFKSN